MFRAVAPADVETLERTQEQSSKEEAAAPLSRPKATERGDLDEASTSGQDSFKEGAPYPSSSRHRSTVSNGKGRQQKQQKRSGPQRRKRLETKWGRVEGFPYKVGDKVVGSVIGGQNGWRIALEYDQEILGFCLPTDLPHLLEHTPRPQWDQSKYGLKREFMIKAIPEDMEYNGKGPLLSARLPDLDLVWQRAAQILEICKEENEYVSISVKGKNSGGLLGSFEGLTVFVPFSFVPWSPSEDEGKESIGNAYIGKDVSVSICDLDRKINRFVGNIVKASQSKAFNSLKVGDLVWGEVQGIKQYGAFISLESFPDVRGLLHIKAVSRSHVDSIQDLFHKGEKVRSIIANIDPDTQRIGLSTAEIEPESGDMLFNKANVYKHAEENAADFRRWVQERQQEVDSGEAVYEGTDGDEEPLAWQL